jgi:hypothetical protein
MAAARTVQASLAQLGHVIQLTDLEVVVKKHGRRGRTGSAGAGGASAAATTAGGAGAGNNKPKAASGGELPAKAPRVPSSAT